MPWRCPQCGVDGLDNTLSSHPIETGGCGFLKFPAGVAFVSDSTGKQIQAHITTIFGGSSLHALADPDLKYVSTEQFKLEKRPEGWAIQSISSAKNPLYLNGAPIPIEGAILKNDDKLSIKDKFFRLTVRFLL